MPNKTDDPQGDVTTQVTPPLERLVMNKDDKRLLGRIFEAEINGRLPLQSKAAAYKRLEAYGLVEFGENILPGRFPVVIKGWYLTHLGRMRYCESCA